MEEGDGVEAGGEAEVEASRNKDTKAIAISTEQAYFIDASFCTFFPSGSTDEGDEFGEEEALASAPAPEPQFYQELIQRFDCLESYFDQ
ncbi:hypothetical protein M5K25_010957 [Dendrobium thyrsiflorum]|uniref:Uncharacterized protein n=1 Tax=Dendrobium thyrsiflorum TaxID=117978 RepID=A0ABD0V1K1_DENTH